MVATSEITPVIRFRKVTEAAQTPTRGSELAAGYDLYSAVDCVVKTKDRALVDTGIQVSEQLLHVIIYFRYLTICLSLLDCSPTRMLWTCRTKEWPGPQVWYRRRCWRYRPGLPGQCNDCAFQLWPRRLHS